MVKQSSKGQVSLEYLMTYGIAIAIVVIAVAALYSMGVFSPKSSAVACSPCFSNFAFVDYAGGDLVIKNGARAINITDVQVDGVSITSLDKCGIDSECSASTQFKMNFTSGASGSTQKVDIIYKDLLSDLNHTDTATIHN